MNLSDQFKTHLSDNNGQISKVTIKNYSSDTRKFILWCERKLGRAFNPNEITKELADSYIQEISENNHSSRSAKRYQSSIKKFFNYLLESRQVRFNPFNLSGNTEQARDPWSLKEFSNFLYNSKTSNLTIKNYISDIRQFLTWTAEVTQTSDVFAQIDNFLIEEYKNRLLDEANFSPLSVNRKLSSLRKYLSFAKHKNLIATSFDLEKSFDDLRIRTASNQISKAPESDSDALESLTNTDPQAQETINSSSYSGFAPLRLFQKIKTGITLASDLLIIASIVKLIEAIKYKLWISTGKEIFASLPQVIRSVNSISNNPGITNYKLPTTNSFDRFIAQGRINHISDSGQIKSIPKSVYAPLEISTEALPFWKRIIHILRYSRPNWYKKYHSIAFVHYLHFGIMVLFAAFIGFKTFQALSSPKSPKTVLASHVSPRRQIAFHGTLYDLSGIPITQESRVRFTIYKNPTESGKALLWQETQLVTPDGSGKFSTLLGKNTTLSQDIFTENPNLYLGITIGSAAELAPRQQLASTGLTKDSQSLQGLKPITVNNADTANSILALDSSGNLTIGGNASTIFQATGGQFSLSGQSLVLASNIGSNGNITLSPDGTGIIDLQKPLQNTSNSGIGSSAGAVEVDDNFAIISSGSAQTALVINQNGTGDIISALSGGTAKFTLNSAGAGSFAADLSILGNNLNTVTDTFTIANTNTHTLNIGGGATTITLGAKTGTTTVNNNLDVIGTLKTYGPVTLSGFTPGAIPFIGAGSQIASDSASLFWDQSNKRLGVGTSTPIARLEIQDSSTNAVTQLSNTSTGTSSIGLQVKLGVTTAPQSTNRWVNFLDGNGTVLGKIRGNNTSNTVTFDANGGDFAEYFKKSNAQDTFEEGDLICHSGTGGVEKCTPNSNGILGILSTDSGFVGAGGHLNDPDYILVGLIGQLKVKIDSNSSVIKPGDPVTLSIQSGKATKALKAGQIIGRALESYAPGSNQPTIKIALNVAWHDPRAVLMNDGSLAAAFETAISNKALSDPHYSEKLAISMQNFVSTLGDGLIEAKNISTESLYVATDNIKIGTQTLREYISAIVNEIVDRKIAENNKKQITIVSPISDPMTDVSKETNGTKETVTLVSSDPSVPSASPSGSQAITNIINIYNTASTSATIASSEASPSATPTPTIEASQSATLQPTTSPSAEPKVSDETKETNGTKEINGIEETNGTKGTNAKNITSVSFKTPYANVATYSAELSYIPNLKSDFAAFTDGLIALGPTSLTDTSINGTLSLGSSMKIGANSIDTLSTDLNLQPLRQGSLSIMGGLVAVDTEGNLSVQGNANFAKDVTIKGKLSAGIIAPVPDSDLIFQLNGHSGRVQNLSSANTSDPGAPQDDGGSKFKVRNSNGTEVLTVNQFGDVIASGAAQFGNIKIIRGAQADTSITETVASGSAGIAIIKANQTERTMISPFVSENSLIYITPMTDTKGITPYIARQTAQEPIKGSRGSFTIQIPSSQLFDIKLNWIIVN